MTFGFHVINLDCTIKYDAKSRKLKNERDKEIVSDKLRLEFEQGIINVTRNKPTCLHDFVCVPKEDGKGRTIVDCSKPKGESVNNHGDKVSVIIV